MTFLTVFEQMMKTRSWIPFSNVKFGKCCSTFSFRRVWFTVFWIACCSNFGHHICQISQCKMFMTSNDLLLYKLEQFIFCCGLEIIAIYVLLTNHIVTQLNPVYQFRWYWALISTTSARTAMTHYSLSCICWGGECKLLEIMVICIYCITTEDTQTGMIFFLHIDPMQDYFRGNHRSGLRFCMIFVWGGV